MFGGGKLFLITWVFRIGWESIYQKVGGRVLNWAESEIAVDWEIFHDRGQSFIK